MLAGETTVARIADAHVVALDAQIRSLKVTRAVLSTVAKRGSGTQEMTLLNRLARLSAAERRRIVEDFVDEVFHGLDTADPVIRERMRSTTADLPEEPTPEQVDAWLELAEMLADPDFRAQMRTVAEFNAADHGHGTPAGASLWFSRRLVQWGARARERGIAPGSPEAAEVLGELLGDADPAVVLSRLRSHATDRVARYRELLALVKGTGPEATYQEEFAWVVAALEAHTAG
ncbi:MerR family transcriptional regulator [Streptomyces indiaensis]|uniref:MerR family transcriptional regulator n=1 Tax=Streptomyces indiaensis TaxID=284033 RepID=A0ABP5QNN2_9ACTN